MNIFVRRADERGFQAKLHSAIIHSVTADGRWTNAGVRRDLAERTVFVAPDTGGHWFLIADERFLGSPVTAHRLCADLCAELQAPVLLAVICADELSHVVLYRAGGVGVPFPVGWSITANERSEAVGAVQAFVQESRAPASAILDPDPMVTDPQRLLACLDITDWSTSVDEIVSADESPANEISFCRRGGGPVSRTPGTDLNVPKALCASRAVAGRRWRAIADRIAKVGVKLATQDVERVALDSTAAELVMANYQYTTGDEIAICVVMPELSMACRRHLGTGATGRLSESEMERWYVKMRDLIVEGMGEFWFALAILADGLNNSPPCKLGLAESEKLARFILMRLMTWWPAFVRFQQRFARNQGANSWNSWASGTLGLLRIAGAPPQWVDELPKRPVEQAGEEIAGWLRRSSSRR